MVPPSVPPLPCGPHSAATLNPKPFPCALQAHGYGAGRSRVHLTSDALQFGNYRGSFQPSHPAYEPAASPEPDGMYSEVR